MSERIDREALVKAFDAWLFKDDARPLQALSAFVNGGAEGRLVEAIQDDLKFSPPDPVTTMYRLKDRGLFNEAQLFCEIAEEAARPEDPRVPKIVSAEAEGPEEIIEWLWPGRIPFGKLTILDGDPGLGKSLVTLDLAARVSTGRPMPLEPEREFHPRPVILISCEDDLADTIRPRLRLAGADRSRISVIQGVVENGQKRPFTLPRDEMRLEAMIASERPALVVVDPFLAFLDEVDSHKDQEIRRMVLSMLAMIAQTYHVAILLLRHLNKNAQGSNAIYRGGGSIAIIAAARAGLVVEVDPDDSGLRVLATTKCNLAAKPRSLSYRVVAAEGHGKVEWELGTDRSATELLCKSRSPKRDEAEEFLRLVLSTGPRLREDIRKLAAEEDISWETIKDAKRRLCVQNEKEKGKEFGRSIWSLP